MDFRLVRGDIALEFFSGASVIVQSTKAIWVLSFPLRVQKLTSARAWWAALVQLAKLDNTFEIYPPGWEQGAGYSGANPQVNGGSQLGTSLVCDNAASSDLVLSAGDPFDVNGEFKVATEDANSDGGGNVTINFEPALRASPPTNDPVDVKTPVCTMRMVSPVVGVSATLPDRINMSFDAVEHFGP
jgi:hypothetical protein